MMGCYEMVGVEILVSIWISKKKNYYFIYIYILYEKDVLSEMSWKDEGRA